MFTNSTDIVVDYGSNFYSYTWLSSTCDKRKGHNVECMKWWSVGRPFNLHPSLLPLLARAVNAVKLCCRVVFQPRWKATRFKSKT